MANNTHRQDEIDIFNFIEMMIKYKYLILSILILSILASFGYLYFVKKRAAPIYSIKLTFSDLSVPKIKPVEHFESLNKKLQNIIIEFRNILRYWFESQAYKSLLQREHNRIMLPNIKITNGGGYINLQFLYPDANEGMSIMSDVVEQFISSDKSQEFISMIKTMIKREKDILQIEANTERSRYEETLSHHNSLIAEIGSVKEKIINMERYLDRKTTANFEGVEIGMQYINFLRNYSYQLNDWLRNLKQKLIGIDRQFNLKCVDIEMLSNEIKEMGQLFVYEKPYYEEIYTDKQLSKSKTVLLFAVIGLFIGVVSAFIIGVREARVNS